MIGKEKEKNRGGLVSFGGRTKGGHTRYSREK